MRSRTFLIFAVVTLALFPVRMQAGVNHQHGGNIDIRTEGDEPLTDCAQLRVRFDETSAARAEQTITAHLSSSPLTIRLPESSGASIRGGDRTDTVVRVCKASRHAEDLPRIAATLGADGHLSVSGPSGGDWLAYVLIETPRRTAVDAQASRGPISIRGLSGDVAARTAYGPLSLADLSGKVRARAENGPISITQCRGWVDAEAVNGPISLRGGGGTQNLQTQNGPISVHLAGNHWDGPRLEAHAANGPLSVRIPENYRTGTRIESAGRSPFTCRAPACSQGRKSWDDDSRTVEFGSGETVVHLWTVNGPVTVESGAEAEEERDE
jgi:hypothetical protein